MLSRDLGGIQQAFIDYDEALRSQGFKVYNITSIFARVNVLINKSLKLTNLGPWDIFSKLYLKFIILLLKPDIIITHGNRAIVFLDSKSLSIIIGVAHNYSTKYLKKCDYIIALTKQRHECLIKENFLPSRIFTVPNMIRMPSVPKTKNYRQPIIIGTIARFVKKKGLDVFIRALARLKHEKFPFKAIIGGEGEEKHYLINLVKELGLREHVEFVGWTKDKEQFFQNIDIFALPSLSEPFGIIVLEAMAHKIPIIATKTEGPCEIIQDYRDLLCDINSSDDLADKLITLMSNYSLAQKYVDSNYLRLKETYDIAVVSKKLSSYLKLAVNNNV